MKSGLKVVSAVIVVFTLFLLFTTSVLAVTNAQLQDMASRTCDYLTANGRIPSKIYVDTQQIDSVTPAELFYMMTRWLRYYKTHNNTPPNTVEIIRATTGPLVLSGVESGTIYLADILAKGESNANYIDANGILPNYSTVGSTSYTTKAMFSVFARTINYYQDHSGTMPNYATVNAVTAPDSWDWARIIANVPYYAQPNGYTCGPTSLKMIMEYYGVVDSVSNIGYWCGTTSSDGTSESGLISGARHYGFSGVHGANDWIALKTAISKGIPVIAHGESWINPGGGHYWVVVGLTKDSNGACSTVICNDPSNSAYLSRTASNFDSHWAFRSKWIMVIK